MPTQVLVPPLGQTVDTLTFVRWLKQEGDAVRQGEPLFEVETDKANLEVEAPASGILSGVAAQAGDEVKALSAIAMIEDGEKPGARAKEQEQVLVSKESPVTLSPSHLATSRLYASPRARRLAEQQDVTLAELAGTGPEGAIVERDVRAYLRKSEVKERRSEISDTAITPVAKRLAEQSGVDWRQMAGTGPGGRIRREDVEAVLAHSQAEAITPSERPEPASDLLETIPLRGVRAVIAERMAASHNQTASVTLTAEADASALVRLRQDLTADGVEVSYNDLLLTILAKALGEHLRLNASLTADGIKLWRRIDIGLAVDTDRGLLVPVVRGVAGKGLAQIAQETKLLAERARAGQCTPDELRGGTFTLTNLGMFGIDAFTPIINLPETAILGVGRIRTQPVWVDDHVEPRQMVWLSLTFDHRLVDGGPAARFLQRVVQLVEKPHLLMA